VAKDNKPADLAPTEREMESWFGMLDDASKADVMKAKIAADAEVEKAKVNSDSWQLGFQMSKLLPWVAIVIVALFSSCTAMCISSNNKDVAQSKIAAEHPTLASPPAASATPAPSK